MKKLVSLILALAMLASMTVLSAASADDVPTLTFLIQGDNTPAENNSVLQALGEKFGCKLEITVVPTADYNGKLNTMIASNQLPDFFQVMDAATLKEMVDAGRLADISGLMDTCAPDIKAYYGEDIYKSTVNSPEAGIYSLYNDAGLYVKNLSMRKDWLAAVDKEVPTTLDELYDVLYAFTYGDPDGNGADDTRGIVMSTQSSSTWEHMLGAFDIPLPSFSNAVCQLDDGTVTTIMKHPRFLEAIDYLRKLYQAGVMDPDFTTLTQMQCFEQLWNGQVGCLDFQAVGTTNNWYPGRYTFEVPENPGDLFAFAIVEGKGSTAQYAAYDKGFAFNANSANLEKALQIVNYFYYTEEGQTLGYLGVEGKHFEWVDKEAGKYTRLGEFTDDVVHRADGAFAYMQSGGFTKVNGETRLMNQTTQDAQNNEWNYVIDYPKILDVLDSRTEYGADLDQIVIECFAELIVTDGDVQAIYDEYVDRWNTEGGLEFEAEATAAYAAQ